MNEYKKYEGKNVDEAIINAMTDLGVAQNLLEMKTVRTESKGFLGIGAKTAVIMARKKDIPEFDPWADSKKKEKKKDRKPEVKEQKVQKKTDSEKPQHEKKQRERKPHSEKNFEKKEWTSEVSDEEALVLEDEYIQIRDVEPIDVTPFIDPAKKFLDDVFKAMKMEVAIDAQAGSDVNTIDINLSGEEMGVLIGKRGQTLDSLQYLTSIIVNSKQENYIRVKVDTENYRQRRKETLENLAKNIAAKVKRTNKAVSLEPMNPYERRIIHSALQRDKYVDTHSEGEEPYRKVVVTPNKNCRELANGGNRNRRSYGNKRYKKQ